MDGLFGFTLQSSNVPNVAVYSIPDHPGSPLQITLDLVQPSSTAMRGSHKSMIAKAPPLEWLSTHAHVPVVVTLYPPPLSLVRRRTVRPMCPLTRFHVPVSLCRFGPACPDRESALALPVVISSCLGVFR